ncbi:MAG: SusD/RagB family nutrient-binding outer membrane lipoprotein [Cyclobacteriaceae bacterium]|nr:SusD/RagB family nutrient-binding outer membrane lipoprotein [Cyclobacteriaceae bacterium]QOI96020.1 MAG: SusD/RagB family nutrient-binding outer membrane lipoprotein [Flammeovirgaceae bacterium]
MKYIKIVLLSLALVMGASCTLDLRENPNALQPGQELPSLVLNTLQINLAGMFQAASSNGMQQTRLQNGAGTEYQNSVRPEDFNGIWSTAYAGILVEANALIPSVEAAGYMRHAGIARVISAYTLTLLVDFFGDVPFSQAFQGSGNFNPVPDDEQDVYDQAIALLEQAKLDLTTPLTTAGGLQNPVAPAITDMYYNNSYGSWVRLANTLLLKIYLNTGDVTELNAVIADPGGLIAAANQNFVFRYGTNASAPDSRHPRFVANYPAGGGNYMSNWLIWHMFHGYDATHRGGDPGDPRIRFYFYRQTNANSTDANQIRCLTENVPSHYPISTGSAIVPNDVAGIPPMGEQAGQPSVDPTDPAWGRTFCYPTDRGYWGRDHQDNQGIPPDGLLRTAWGAYPSGGRFDANVNTGVSAGVGMRGAGFQPIMMRSFVQFMLSEANLRLGATTPLTAVQHFEEGIRASMADVRDWAVNGTYGTTPVAAAPTEAGTINGFYPAATYTTDVNNYVTAAVFAFNSSAANALNYLAREYWIALYGNGVEAYNLYRRTGRPTGMQPTQNPVPGAFPRSFWYPANAANLNNQIQQKTDLEGKIFWDTNTTNLDF